MGLEVVSTRYGAAAVDALAAALAQAKAGNPLRPVTVVVPSNYAGVAARRALARRHGIANVGFVTLYRLAELVAGATLAQSGRVPISSPVLATAFRGALAPDPGIFGPVADEPSTVEALRRVHRELRELTDAELSRLAAHDARARTLVRIDREVTARLGSRWYDETDLLTTATRLVRDRRRGSAPEADHVIVHLPQRLSTSGSELLLALAERGTVTVLVGRVDDTVPGQATSQVLGRLGITDRPTASAVATTTRVETIVAADEDDEVRTALRRLLRAAEEGTPFERMLVVYGPGAGYGRLLVDHLTAAGLPWNGVADVPLSERLPGRTLLGLLALDPAALGRDDVFALLASSPAARERPIAAWERLARRACVVAGRGQWEERLAVLAAELRAQAAVSREPSPWQWAEADRVEALATFVATLAERLEPPSQPTWAAYARWSRRLLEHLLGGIGRRSSWSRDEQRAAERVDSILERLGRLDAVDDQPAGPTGARPDGGRAPVDRRVFQAALEAEMADGLTTLGRLGEGLFIGPVALAVGIDADVVIVLGLVEGCLPGGLGDDPLLSDASRRALDGALPTATERRERLHHQLLAVTGAAEVVVVASRPRSDLRSGRARYPSRWIAAIGALGPPGPLHRHHSFHAGLHDGLPGASEQEVLLADLHLLALALLPVEDHPLAAADNALRHALALVRARASDRFTAFDGNLADLAAAGVDLGPWRPTSASALESWAVCPFSYFVRDLLGVRELDALEEELSIRPAERGILVHAVLEAVVAGQIANEDLPAPDMEWSAATQCELRAQLRAWCSTTEARGVVGHPLHWRLEQRRLGRRIDAFLTLDREARAELGVTPVATEMEFGYARPFTIELPGGRSLVLAGKVDRVDASRDRVTVIDYKTSRPPRGWKPDPFTDGIRLQLPIYGLAAREHLGRPQAEMAAEYWHLGDGVKARKRLTVDVGEGTAARLPAVLAHIADAIAAGLFVPHPDEPDPWRRWRCSCCDPDGADTATLWGQWQAKRDDPALAPYLNLIDNRVDTVESGLPDADREGQP